MNELKKDLAELEEIIKRFQEKHECEIMAYNSAAGLTVKAETTAEEADGTTEPTVKVGDKIRITEDKDRLINIGFHTSCEELAGTIQKVSGIDGGGWVSVDGLFLNFSKETYTVLPKEPQYREVKRAANVGERIRVVHKWDNEDTYENGDEFVVTGYGFVREYRRVTLRSGRTYFIAANEYVVLEEI